MAKRDWRDIGSVKGRQAGRRRQESIDAAWREAHPERAKNPWVEASTQVVTDTDTIETLAEKNGVDPANILDANPELKYVKAGMVVNIPRANTPGSPAWRDQNIYSGGPGSVQNNPELKYTQGGLPSNAALGGTTTNPQGLYRQGGVNTGGLSSTISGSAGTVNYQQNFLNTERSGFGVPLTNATANQPRSLFGQSSGSLYVPPGLSQTQRAAIPGIVQSRAATPQPTAATNTPPTGTAARGPGGLPMNYPGGFLRWARTEMDQINSPSYTPNSMAVAVLERAGFLVKDNQPTVNFGGTGGGYSGGRGGGGGRSSGGGGGVRGSGGGGGVPRAPAFASQASFRGLTNWRI
jgi:hypothetical protein